MIQIGTHFMWGDHEYRVVTNGVIYGYEEKEEFVDSSYYSFESIAKEVERGVMKLVKQPSPEIY